MCSSKFLGNNTLVAPVSLLDTCYSSRRPKKHVKRRKLPSSDEESSDSDDETLLRKAETKRKKKRITEDTDDEPGVQDTLKEMKKMLQVLCEKVEQNEKCLKEIKTLRLGDIKGHHPRCLCTHTLPPPKIHTYKIAGTHLIHRVPRVLRVDHPARSQRFP